MTRFESARDRWFHTGHIDGMRGNYINLERWSAALTGDLFWYWLEGYYAGIERGVALRAAGGSNCVEILI